MKNKKIFIFLSLLFTMTCLFNVKVYADIASKRLFGQNRYETASKIAECYNNDTVNNVILVSGEDFPDALSASVLAHKINAPILLANSSSAGTANAFDYISKHLDKSGNIYVIGSATDASGNFMSSLNQMGYSNIVEIGNDDKYYTNYMVAQQINVPQNTPVIISSGENYPDALGISSFAAYNNWPILLVPNDTLPDKTSQFLISDKPSKVYITGGVGVITSKVEEQIRELVPDAKITRFAGKDRFDTNAQIVQAFASEPQNIYLASGYGFADALSGSVLAAQAGDPIVLIDPAASTVPAAIAPLLCSYQAEFQNVISFGGSSVVPESVAAKAKNITSEDLEVARAVSLGIGSYSDNNAITYKEFFKMLDAAVTLVNPADLPEWENKFHDARSSDSTMLRQEGMLALYYAAETLGPDYNTTNSDYDGKTNDWDQMSWNYPLFPGWDQPAKLGTDTWNNYMTAAYFYSMGRISLYSGKSIFDYDPTKNSMLPADPLSYEAALRAALRLYYSGVEVTDRVSSAEDTRIISLTDQRRNTILNSKTSVKITGTAYYVSNSGNDNNDGLSPKTSWATIAKVNSMDFKPGDGVLFERGGLWREIPKYRTNIIYSAYGEGPKPKIYGSPENGADPKKWALLDGTKNIWVFYKDMYDTSCIVFDEGESWATRKLAFWDGSKYVELLNNSEPIDVKKLDNLKFLSLPDYTGFSSKDANLELNKKGKLYLRCDAGNPGLIYNSIEFLSNPNDRSALVSVGANSVVDNLCVMYGNECGICLEDGSIGSIVQNCEVAWVGGSILWFNLSSFTGQDTNAAQRGGDGIVIHYGTNNSVIDNYIHHTYDFAFTEEIGPWCGNERFAQNNMYKGNLAEYCSGGALMADWASVSTDNYNNPLFSNFTIEDNYFMYIGYGWSHHDTFDDFGNLSRPNNGNCSIVFAFAANSCKDINVKSNIFYLSRYGLVSGEPISTNDHCYPQKFNINFSGNTYVQNTYGLLTEWGPGIDNQTARYLYNINAQKTVNEVLGDKTGKVLPMQLGK